MRLLYHFSYLISIPFSLSTAGQNLFCESLDFWGGQSYHTDDKNTSDAARAASGAFCLTTVYPTDTTRVHGNSGGKSAGKDVFPSGKGRKCLEINGNRYFQILWELDAAGSSPVTSSRHE